MNLDNERKAFEEYYIANYHDGDIHPNQQLLEWSENGEFYFATSVNDLWDMWLASANRQGYKLVPVETLEESLSWASIAKWDSPSKESDLEIEKHEKIIETMIGACDDH